MSDAYWNYQSQPGPPQTGTPPMSPQVQLPVRGTSRALALRHSVASARSDAEATRGADKTPAHTHCSIQLKPFPTMNSILIGAVPGALKFSTGADLWIGGTAFLPHFKSLIGIYAYYGVNLPEYFVSISPSARKIQSKSESPTGTTLVGIKPTHPSNTQSIVRGWWSPRSTDVNIHFACRQPWKVISRSTETLFRLKLRGIQTRTLEPCAFMMRIDVLGTVNLESCLAFGSSLEHFTRLAAARFKHHLTDNDARLLEPLWHPNIEESEAVETQTRIYANGRSYDGLYWTKVPWSCMTSRGTWMGMGEDLFVSMYGGSPRVPHGRWIAAQNRLRNFSAFGSGFRIAGGRRQESWKTFRWVPKHYADYRRSTIA
ncbi:hypothetical protein C8R45DRAFT_933056 [Mycena sanguinolenta]|nr:hypothetical protein C8R45DRAFT_933056 [Mycena sanguinolenta]